MPDAFDLLDYDDKERQDIQTGQRVGAPQDAFDEVQPYNKENVIKSWLRTIYQFPSGALERYTYPLNLIQMLGNDALDPDEIEQIRKISEREGIPFDEEKYRQSVEEAASLFPTQQNIEGLIEEKTGLPLTPKTTGQHLSRLSGLAGAFKTGGLSQKATAAVAAPSASIAAQTLGVPEPIANVIGLGAGGALGEKIPSKDISIAQKTKSSGLPVRRFEKLKSPREVTPKKFEKINEALEQDFKKISEEILEKSPIKRTLKEFRENPEIELELNEEFKRVETLAEKIPEKINTNIIKDDLRTKIKDRFSEGITPSDYDKEYAKALKSFIQDTPKQDINFKNIIKQYRKNNKSLSGYYDPSKPFNINQAKKDALLDYNRVLANIIDEAHPNSDFSNLFKSTNKMKSQISDIQSIDKFQNSLFDGKINFNEARKIFKNKNVSRPFERALGDYYPEYKTLVKDMLSSEKYIKNLKVAKQKGYEELFKTGLTYVVHPKLGALRSVYKITKDAHKELQNAILDKPQLVVKWKNASNALKQGKFETASRLFAELDSDITSDN